MNKRVITVLLGVVAMLWATPAYADLVVAKTSAKEKGATEITWNSSFYGGGYDCSPIVLYESDLGVVVEEGDAAFVSFIGKKNVFTPKKKVSGSYIAGETFTVDLDKMHHAKKDDMYIANVHFKARMDIEKDGLPGLEARADYGVNLHLERPDVWGNCQ